jgi:hypothetical protein
LQDGRQLIFRLVEGTFKFSFFYAYKRSLISIAGFIFRSIPRFPKIEEDGEVFNSSYY